MTKKPDENSRITVRFKSTESINFGRSSISNAEAITVGRVGPRTARVEAPTDWKADVADHL
jgi:hypothetical protein